MTVLVTALLALAHAPVSSATPGVDRDTIKIGLHAPLTGASPVASDSVDRGKDLYFRWLARRGNLIDGRRVRVILRNDQYNPSTAVEVCREMIEEAHVFMLFGHAGVDPMQACARLAASRDTPYVAPGNTRVALDRLPTYFATTMSWPHLGRRMADFLVSKGARRDRNGVLHYNTGNSNPTRDRFVAAMEKRNASVHYDRSVSITAGANEAALIIAEMQTAEIDNALVLTTPVFFLQLLHQAADRGYFPLWTALDHALASDPIVRIGCRLQGPLRAKFLSPYPAFVDRDRFDPNFDRALKAFYPDRSGDDTMWKLWAHQKVIAKMLRRSGGYPTRNRFVRRVARSDFRTGIGPLLHYRPSDHFGARSTHLLRARCRDQRLHTVRSFVRDF
jgi:branched-chain amino acid transport system substrate-binding protein